MTRSFSLLAQLAAQGPLAEVKPMSAPAIRGLAATIREAAQSLTGLATKAAADLQTEVDGFKSDVADVQGVVADVRGARAELRAALGQGTNGGPALDETPTQSPPSAGASPNTEITAIGPIQR